jgi:hypothetical protein
MIPSSPMITYEQQLKVVECIEKLTKCLNEFS